MGLFLCNVSGQKGGAKGAMRGRGKGGKSRGGGGNRGGGYQDAGDFSVGEFGGGYGGKGRPCIGLCYLRKLRGQPPEPEVTARPCVGLCYLKKLNGELGISTTRKPKAPCIGLCYLERIGKIVKNKSKEAEGEDEDEIMDDEYELEGSVEVEETVEQM